MSCNSNSNNNNPNKQKEQAQEQKADSVNAQMQRHPLFNNIQKNLGGVFVQLTKVEAKNKLLTEQEMERRVQFSLP